MTDQNRIQITTQSKDRQVSVKNTGIEIRHEGKPIKGSSASGETSGKMGVVGSVLLLIDCSSSMEGGKLAKAKNGAMSFSRDALGKGYLVGLVKFESHAKLIVEPSNDLSQMEIGLATLKADGATNMEEAVYVSAHFLEGLTGQKIIVIVTDGIPTSRGDPQTTLKAGEFAKNNHIDIMAIGTDDADQEFLSKLASRSELGMKVTHEKFEQTIASSFKMLPSSSKIVKY